MDIHFKLHESVYVLQEECSDFFSNDTEDIFDDKDQQGNFIKNYFVINGITLGQTTKREIINWGGLQRFSFPGTYKMRDGTCCNFHSDSEIVNNIFLESGERTDDRNVNKVHLPDFYTKNVGLSWATTVYEFRNLLSDLGFKLSYAREGIYDLYSGTIWCESYKKDLTITMHYSTTIGSLIKYEFKIY